MDEHKIIFTRCLDDNGIKWNDRDKSTIVICYTGDNLQPIEVVIEFSPEYTEEYGYMDDYWSVTYCWSIANLRGKEDIGISICNELNRRDRWVKFCIDDDSNMVCRIDALFTDQSCGEICNFFVDQIIGDVDDVYPDIMERLGQ